MSGFDNGSAQIGVSQQAKQFGRILFGSGPPVPQAGVVGDVYYDVQQSYLYTKRSTDASGGIDPWGHYLFQVPPTYQGLLKWFATANPTDDMGANGDFCLQWAGFPNYGLQPGIFGPKAAGGWTENGNSLVNTQLDPAFAGSTFPQQVGLCAQIGILDEGPALLYSTSTQEIATGVSPTDEFVLSIPITSNGGDPILQVGAVSVAALVPVTLNALYTAQDAHGV